MSANPYISAVPEAADSAVVRPLPSLPTGDGIDPTLHSISYLRVSTKDQATKGGEPEGLSIPAQRAAIEAKAALGYATAIRVHFSDMGESARTADRPGLKQLLTYLLVHKVDYVFVHKIDRLARNRFDDIEITMAIQKSGARLVSVTENIDETPSGMLMHGIMSSIAEFYSRNLANEVIKGLDQKARSGGTPARAPLGYQNVRTLTAGRGEVRSVEVDTERAPLVKLAFDLYLTNDYTIERLAATLAQQGLTSRPTSKRAAAPLSISQLSALLRNPYYTGVVTYKGERYPGRHEPLIDDIIFEQAQEILEVRSRQGSRDRVHLHYLKGQLFCDRCAAAGRPRWFTAVREHHDHLVLVLLGRGGGPGRSESGRWARVGVGFHVPAGVVLLVGVGGSGFRRGAGLGVGPRRWRGRRPRPSRVGS